MSDPFREDHYSEKFLDADFSQFSLLCEKFETVFRDAQVQFN
jgi:hypothetical protein